MAKELTSGFLQEDYVKTYQTEMPLITLKKFKAYCKLFGTPENIYFLKKGTAKHGINRYTVPGLYIMSMFRETVAKLHKEDPEFPISIANHMKEPAYASLEESTVSVGDKLIFKAQVWSIRPEGKNIIVGARIEVCKGNSVVFKATLEFIQYG